MAVPSGHPWNGKGLIEAWGAAHDVVAVHGGLTYANACDGWRICHVARPGESGDVWWFGFDCAHGFDSQPGMDALLGRIMTTHDALLGRLQAESHPFVQLYRPVAYVQEECRHLAAQLAKVGAKAPSA